MKLRVMLILAVVLSNAPSSFAQRHEVAFTSGGLKIGERGFDLPQPGFLRFGSGFTYEISYARRLLDARLAALYFELPLAGTPRTKVKTTNALSPDSYSSIFFSPGIKLKLLPGRKYSPFATMGFGVARFNESDSTIANQPNPNEGSETNGVFAFGLVWMCE